MKEFIYQMVDFISHVHERILDWNYENVTVYSDKELHFWVMGFLGIALLLIIYPLFLFLAKRCILAIAGLYVFTLMFVIAFAIEIEQGITGTGVMDFGDAVSGLRGFMWMFAIFAAGRFVLFLITKTGKALLSSNSSDQPSKQKVQKATKNPSREDSEDNAQGYFRDPEEHYSDTYPGEGYRRARRYRSSHAASFHSVRS